MAERHSIKYQKDKTMLLTVVIILLTVLLAFHWAYVTGYEKEKESLRRERDLHILKADSLLAAKLQADKEIHQLKRKLLHADSLKDKPAEAHQILHNE